MISALQYKEIARACRHEFGVTTDSEALKSLELLLVQRGFLQPDFVAGENWPIFSVSSSARASVFVKAIVAAMGGSYDHQGLYSFLGEMHDPMGRFYWLPLLPEHRTPVETRLYDFLSTAKHPIWIDRTGAINIIYMRATTPTLVPQNSQQDRFDDVRVCFVVQDDTLKVLGVHQVTIDPGTHFIRRPMNRLGTAFIMQGQYKAWKEGKHKGHPALVQCGPIMVSRDKSRDGIPDSAPMVTMDAGLNQHKAGKSSHRVGAYSAGCLVSANSDDHDMFMKWCDQYRPADKVFISTIIR